MPLIAPHKLNPAGERWLPILHTTRGDRHYTALFSNTETAHRMGRTHDWVVIYFDGRREDQQQCTVVTEYRGVLARRRVVRGRESECVSYYRPNARIRRRAATGRGWRRAERSTRGPIVP